MYPSGQAQAMLTPWLVAFGALVDIRERRVAKQSLANADRFLFQLRAGHMRPARKRRTIV